MFLTRVGATLVIGGAVLYLLNPQVPFALMMLLGMGALALTVGLRSPE